VQHRAQKILLNTPKMFDSYSKGTFEYEYSRNSPKKSNFEYRIRIEYYHYYRRWCTIQEVYRCGASSTVVCPHSSRSAFYGFCSPPAAVSAVSLPIYRTSCLYCVSVFVPRKLLGVYPFPYIGLCQ